MEVIDISQEVFGCDIFPGDPRPEKKKLSDMDNGGICNVAAINMCAHNGTHVDAPYHFYNDGKTIDQIPLDRFIGLSYVAKHEGDITSEDAADVLNAAKTADPLSMERILIKGNATLTAGAAKVFAQAGIKLYGNESQTVGPIDSPAEIHLIMLGAQIILLEGIRLEAAEEGVYLLHAAPLNLGGADGAPCRATLIKL